MLDIPHNNKAGKDKLQHSSCCNSKNSKGILGVLVEQQKNTYSCSISFCPDAHSPPEDPNLIIRCLSLALQKPPVLRQQMGG
ncbi:hypothetical protein GDO86_004327 [Hymenochirus boettgeri]|uniref:Uncharacterized protein n=1 Tax=Hymenochirus boettgeri TaxID=247094 RepID=A0A8T2KDF6_9PIPI|nr:hypothetical protein GDO86_004327 [Hymenochirus boettgeri]